MSAPRLLISVPIEGLPEFRILADSLEDEIALRAWLGLGFAKRDIGDGLDHLDECPPLEESA